MTNPATAPHLLCDGPPDAVHRIILAHGAGQPSSSPYMTRIAGGLAAHGIAVARFDFPYMRIREETGRKRPPDRQPILIEAWREVFAAFGGKAVIGGKSMGGRMASLVADEIGAKGLLCLGYPFHPTGRPDKLRTEHLAEIQTPTLILQGTRDPFGGRDEVGTYALSTAIRVAWIEDGDHSFKPRKASGRTEDQNMADAIAAVAKFVTTL
ncbi:MAG: alpha/beta fold hydrolase [Proteobacteria bacterium]|nr:alpha/beta fold hydrolase [Pseudomonadota bacterium]